MTKNTLKTETINGLTFYALGKSKIFLNQLNHKSLLASFNDPFKTEKDKYDFFSWDFVGSAQNLVMFASPLNKSMNFVNWQKFFVKLETPKNNPIYQGIMTLGKALANGQGIEKLKDVPPNTNVASSPTANFNLKDMAMNPQLKELAMAMKDQIILELKKEANK